MPVTINCNHCSKEFLVKPYQVEDRKWCSLECKNAANRVPKVCQHCATDFWIFASQERKGLGQFCTKKCKDLSRTHPKKEKVVRELVFKVCLTCEKTFRVPPIRKDTAKYCSLACKVVSPEYLEKMRNASVGEKSPRWTGGKYYHHTGYVVQRGKGSSSKVFQYEHQNVMLDWMLEVDPNHPFLIEVDGKKRFTPLVVVHHIDRIRTNNDRSNLLVITKDAHAAIHNHGRKPQPWECWPSNPTKW